MKQIKLSNGMECIVDDEDFDFLSKWKWKYHKALGCYGGYAVRNSYDRKTKKHLAIFIHRLVNNTPAGLSTDHINGNKLDNRKENLRSVTQVENMHNRGKQKNNRTGTKGVFFDKSRNKFVASLVINGVEVFRKRFKTLNEAIDARKLSESANPTATRAFLTLFEKLK